MTPRIPPVQRPDDEQREALAKTLPAPDGEPLNVFLTLAHVPRLLRRINALGGYFMAHGGIPVREREIVILRTAAHARSHYEIGQHRWIGAEAGLTEKEIEAAVDPSSPHLWSDDDAALLAYTDELMLTGTVSDAAWTRIAKRSGEQRCVELLALVGFYRMLAGILNGIRVELDPSVAERIAP